MRNFFRGLGIAFAFFVVLIVAGGCWLVYDTHRSPAGNAEYVALGSSFGAGPGVGSADPDAPVLCNRSTYNYAHLLARTRKLSLTDMTCSGATAVNVLDGGQYGQGPQIDALRPTTKLVTVTVGGNDIAYLGNLFAWSCQSKPEAVSWIWRRLACTPTPQDVVQGKLAGLETSMLQIAKAVHQRSPQAQLVFVDYTTVLPEAGGCPDRLPITTDQLDRSRVLADRLKAITEEVAKQSGATLVKASEVTQAHHICSSDPWVFGWVLPATPFNFGPMAFHPTDRAMSEITDTIDRTLQTF